MKNMKKQITQFRTHFNYKWLPEYGTPDMGDSLTVPGEAYTIQQLLDRAQGGIPINTLVDVKDGHYASDADFDTFVPGPDHDMVDTENMAEEALAVIADAKQKIESTKKQKATPSTKQAKEDQRTTEPKSEGTAQQIKDDSITGLETPQPDPET